MSEHTHRYGDHEHTSVLPPYSEPAGPAPGPPPGPAPARRRRGATAGILAAALVLGGAAGVGGAAGFEAWNDDGGSTVRAPLNTARSTSSSDEDDTPAPEGSAEAVAASVLPSVVKINVTGQAGSGSGSGIILSEDGEILTNNHVVEGAEDGARITVNFDDGSGASAEVVGTDPVTDLAVIKAQDVEGLTPATLGDSDQLDVGEAVVAIGSPFGLEATVTSGIVSALNRPVSVPREDAPEEGELPGLPGAPQVAPVTSTTYPAIQTDAAINPGNSGGPLVNLAGEVVGINSSIRSTGSGVTGQAGSIGLGFAIPITKVLPIVEQLRAGEEATHARLGVTVSTSGLDDGLVTGAGIESVEEGSAADEAGLQDGDVVTRVDDVLIAGSDSLVAVIRGYRPGDEVTLTIVRDGEEQELQVTLDSDLESADS